MATIRCPVCGAAFDPQTTKAMPFCGERCRQIDLSRWLGEGYSIPASPPDEEGEESAEQ